MQNVLLRAVPLAALALLSACDSKPTTITGAGPVDTTANEIAAAPPVKLPPAVLASKQYRCKDNSLAFVDFMNDGTSANYRTKKEGTPTALTAPAAGQPYAGGDVTVTGQATDKSITLKAGGKSQECDG
ncbi:hypothetical protein [Sphingomonas nostoxanthinifaciens]|uniref:hypothetical protein n=1 Tax=Sphingomonas nostoxanthinifaciens TaxID=2872652 RepID=UPI001CC1DA67|nr:hypothetical protein [Sphingomonas nostoxanthinifaciens]UAK24932.1 hypothetical protein K8P63_01570 [Sphingomonas nostoxanthinifaciens]